MNERLLRLFKSHDKFSLTEDFTSVKFNVSSQSTDKTSVLEFGEYVDSLTLGRDNYTLSITYFGRDEYVSKDKIDFGGGTLYKWLEQKFGDSDDNESQVTIQLEIFKGRNPYLFIYDVGILCQTLVDIELQFLIAKFDSIISDGCRVLFVDDESRILCNSIIFGSELDPESIDTFKPSDSLIGKLQLLSSFENRNIGKFLPTALDIRNFHKAVGNTEELKNLLILVRNVMSIFYVFDISKVEGNRISLRLNGYKLFDLRIDFKDFVNDPQYFDIFEWVINGGNISDKMGIARNIISLNLENTSTLELHNGAFESVKSAYKIYETQNINKYIEMRSKLSESLLDFSNKASKIAEEFSAGFQRSAFALLTFFITYVCIKLVGTNSYDDGISFSSLILTYSFVGGSFIYLIYQIWDYRVKRFRFIKLYQTVKSRQLDIFTLEDINRILKNDSEHHDNLDFLRKQIISHTIIWIAINMLILGVSFTLYLLKFMSIFKFISLFIQGPSC